MNSAVKLRYSTTIAKGVIRGGYEHRTRYQHADPDSTRLERGHAALPVATLDGIATSPLTSRLGRWPWSVLTADAMSIITLALVRETLVERDRYGHTLRFYITPHFAKCQPAASLKLRLVSGTASRPAGFTKQALCKVACAICRWPWRCGMVSALRAMCLSQWPTASQHGEPRPPLAVPLRGNSLAQTARLPPRGALSRAGSAGLVQNYVPQSVNSL